MMSFSNSEALDFLHELNKLLSSSLNVPPIMFNKENPVGNGSTISHFDEIEKAEIGVFELANNEIDEYTFMKAFVSLLHETTHIFQHKTLLYQNDDSSIFIAIGICAAMTSKIYYKSNYLLMQDEIAAQYSALKNAYGILCKYISVQEANDMICRYVNNHIQDEFIQEYEKNYFSVAEIFTNYKKAFEKSRSTKRKIDVEKYRTLLTEDNELCTKDLIAAMVNSNSDKLSLILKSKTGIQQDFYLTCIYFRHKYKNDIKRIRNIEFKSISDLNYMQKFPGFKLKSYYSIKHIRLDDITPDLSHIINLQMLPNIF